jgi:hypothetical protein
MIKLARAKRELQRLGITQQRVADEVKRIFPDRGCTKHMVNHVLNGRARSSFVSVAIERLLVSNGRKAS